MRFSLLVRRCGPGRRVDADEMPRQRDNDDVIDCVCGIDEEAGLMIMCETCSVWFHIDCVGLTRTALPPSYQCLGCQGIPRPHFVQPVSLERPLKRKYSAASAATPPSARSKTDPHSPIGTDTASMRSSSLAEQVRYGCAELAMLSSAYALLESELTTRLRGRPGASDPASLMERLTALDRALDRLRAEMVRLSQLANETRGRGAASMRAMSPAPPPPPTTPSPQLSATAIAHAPSSATSQPLPAVMPPPATAQPPNSAAV